LDQALAIVRQIADALEAAQAEGRGGRPTSFAR
jgi:hypothetical protein